MKKIILLVITMLSVQFVFADGSAQAISVKVTEKGFEPSEIKTKAGDQVILKITRTTDTTCATMIQFKEKKIKKDLPLNKEVIIELGKLPKGDIRFACGMDMTSGHIITE